MGVSRVRAGLGALGIGAGLLVVAVLTGVAGFGFWFHHLPAARRPDDPTWFLQRLLESSAVGLLAALAVTAVLGAGVVLLLLLRARRRVGPGVR